MGSIGVQTPPRLIPMGSIEVRTPPRLIPMGLDRGPDLEGS